jgi:hypothetical protein
VTFYLSDNYLTIVIDTNAPDGSTEEDKIELRKKPIIALLMSIIAIIITITILYWCARKTFQRFKQAIVDYETFLLTFKETPRSKYAKKYIPPRDPLPEESTIIDQTVSVIYPHKNSRGLSNMTKSQISGNYESKMITDNIVENILTTENMSEDDLQARDGRSSSLIK